jgi:hypothetical protein
LAGLQFLDGVQEEAASCSTASWVSVDGPATLFGRMSIAALELYGETGSGRQLSLINPDNKLKQS